ncbi:very long chain fatty acid elongase 4-like [Nomia melanderi]|uniref:very long chain fatty acid elongase 4-like n=1 Tax=Nomia melanderi TaxID=2448451 RepID=UPI003FCCE453
MSLAEIYHRYNTELADGRTNSWTMITSLIPLTLMSALYLYFVLDYGPKYMKDKKPYSFKTFIFGYNVFQIIANALLIYHTFDAGWYTDGFMHCTKLDYTYSRNAYKMAQITWYLLCLKVIDYIETILYVLRKKDRQVSFLHLYHHVSTVFVAWLTVKYFPNGYAMTLFGLNCGIHVLMYTYYLLSSYGPKIQKILAPIKPMVTLSQIIQFLVMLVYMMQSFIPGCAGTETAAIIMITDVLINLGLFCNFYKINYMNKKIKKNED